VISNLVVASMVKARVTAANALMITSEAKIKPSKVNEIPPILKSSLPSTVNGITRSNGNRKKNTILILLNANPSGNLEISNIKNENRNPKKAILISLTKTIEKISKVNDTSFARGSNRWIGESNEAYASISGYSI
jgi:hypothetical protein